MLLVIGDIMKIVFISLLGSGREFILTDKAIAKLSIKHGRNVEVELKAASQKTIPEKTFYGFLRYLDKCLVNTANSGYESNCH